MEEAILDLQKHIGKPDDLLYLWKCIIAFEGVEFTTAGRGRNHSGSVVFTYEISKDPSSRGKHYDGVRIEGFGNVSEIRSDCEWMLIGTISRDVI